MFPLKQQLAEFGFEARENYDYAVQCFLNSPNHHIPCLNVDGDPGRRKTAFAHALAQVMDVHHILYYEFDMEKTASQMIRVIEGEEVIEAPPTSSFDRIMTEACTLSEAETAILILDHLHLAKFKQHLRLYEFIKNSNWSYSDASFHANNKNLQIFIMSSEPLYHSLQQVSFRLWISAEQGVSDSIQPVDLGLDESCSEWLEPLNELLDKLGQTPAISEYKRLVHDIEHHVRTPDQLRISIFGWVEGVDRQCLSSKSVDPYISKVIEVIEANLSIQEEIELSSGNKS
jgi:hypothetical protein